MASKKVMGIGGFALTAAVLAGVGIAVVAANPGDGNEAPITGEALGKASAAALAHTGGGRVSDTEMGDEDSYYEVEVTLPDGRQVDVHLDQQFKVVGEELENGSQDDREGED